MNPKDKISDKVREREAAALLRLFDSKKTKISQGAFGALHRIGSQSMVWQYLENRRPLNKDAAAKFAKGLKVSVQDFSPRLAKEIANLHKAASASPLELVGDNFRNAAQLAPIPLISWVIAGMLKEIEDLPDPEIGEWPLVQPSVKMGPKSWALIVEGDSMDDRSPDAIPAGHILFCDPEAGYTPNCLVIAKNTDSQRATFKQLITEDGKWYLKAWNKDSNFGVNGRLLIDDPALRVIAVVTRSRAPDRVH